LITGCGFCGIFYGIPYDSLTPEVKIKKGIFNSTPISQRKSGPVQNPLIIVEINWMV
jgi:hypothetical protein